MLYLANSDFRPLSRYFFGCSPPDWRVATFRADQGDSFLSFSLFQMHQFALRKKLSQKALMSCLHFLYSFFPSQPTKLCASCLLAPLLLCTGRLWFSLSRPLPYTPPSADTLARLRDLLTLCWAGDWLTGAGRPPHGLRIAFYSRVTLARLAVCLHIIRRAELSRARHLAESIATSAWQLPQKQTLVGSTPSPVSGFTAFVSMAEARPDALGSVGRAPQQSTFDTVNRLSRLISSLI
ncbi:unnamed protein product [Protopolystoma xenopodis]|uniref:Uncharacterized protein n=1 Tax=Protopolystoma xenopodis TaxID=117903 RepID=A0A3S5FET7_9PLAT|nr:unnamed protein product [Protopolystoma xenopodis]